MSKPKLTPWFPGSVKPVRPGVYEVKIASGLRMFKRWRRASGWSGAAFTAEDANRSRFISKVQASTWRGIASPPEVSK